MTTKIEIQRAINLGAVKVWPLNAPAPEVETKTSFNSNLLKFEEMPDPDPNMLQVTNPTAEDITVLWGTVIAGLQQTRMCAVSVIVPRGMTIGLDTFCVEQHRFSNPVKPEIAGRAPLTVMSAGSIFDSDSKRWIRGTSVNQRRVWSSVSRQEVRGGRRATSSLEQIMREDSETFDALRSFHRSIESAFEGEETFNGFAIAVGDQPMLMEVLGKSSEAPRLLEETLRGLAFDLESQIDCVVTDSEIERFIDSLTDHEIARESRGDWEWSLEGGDASAEIRQLLDRQGSLVQVTMVNKQHRTLIGV